MKILIVSAANSIHTVRWVNAFVERGYEVHLAYCNNHAPKDNKISDKVKLVPLKFSAPLGYYLNAPILKKVIKSINPDIINVHYASGYGTLARMAKIKKYVLSVWGSDVYDYPYTSKSNYKRVVKNLKNATALASTSIVMAEQTKKILENPSKQITITPFGVDINRFKPIDNKMADPQKIKIGTIKTLDKKYGITDSVRAFKILLDKYESLDNDKKPQLEYEIYGQGPQKDEIQNLIKELDLEDKIFLKGYVENIKLPQILNTFDIFLAASTLNSESFGVAVVEAMSCGLPCVVTDADGLKEVVENNHTGIVVEKENVNQIAEALFTLSESGKLREEYGRNGRSRVEKLYNWDDNVDSMINLYKNLIQEKVSD